MTEQELVDDMFLDLLIKMGRKVMNECLIESEGMVIPMIIAVKFQRKWLEMACMN